MALTTVAPLLELASYHAAQQRWPFIRLIEGRSGLPDCLLFAVGYRETGLDNEVGDGGHGHGVWQLDDRSHRIPTGFDQDVEMQATAAALQLGSLLTWAGGRLPRALAAYNAGQGAVTRAIAAGLAPDSVTTGGNYGSACIAYLLAMHADHIRQLRAGVSASYPTP